MGIPLYLKHAKNVYVENGICFLFTLSRSRDPQRDLSNSWESFKTDALIYYLSAPKYKDKVQIHTQDEFIKKKSLISN